MGRCYEFGVAVHEGCEQPMVVPAEGGKCVCATCGAVCHGKFRGCDAIISQPGYVPLAAPRAASEQHRGLDATPPSVAVTASSAVVPSDAAPATVRAEPAVVERLAPIIEHQLAEVAALVESLAARPDRSVEAIVLLNRAMAARDEELAGAFERLTGSYERLIEEVRDDRGAVERLERAVTALADRLASLETRRPFPYRGAAAAGE